MMEHNGRKLLGQRLSPEVVLRHGGVHGVLRKIEFLLFQGPFDASFVLDVLLASVFDSHVS